MLSIWPLGIVLYFALYPAVSLTKISGFTGREGGPQDACRPEEAVATSPRSQGAGDETMVRR